jgi:AraC-like DNA-binding protein
MSKTPSILSVRPSLVAVETDVLADVLETMRLSNVIYGRFELGAPWGLRFGPNDLAHFYVVARGGALLEREGEPTLALSAGDVVLLPNGGAHVLCDAPDSPLSTLGEGECKRHAPTGEPMRLGGDGARTSIVAGAFRFVTPRRTGLLERLPSVIHLASNDPRSAPWLSATVQLIVAESASPGPGTAVIVSRLADVLLVQALRTQASTGPCGKVALTALADPNIGHALQLMHGQPGEDWTVESLAKAVGISRSGFAARFTELIGEPPLQYLARWRMAKAAQALRESDASLVEIAERVGYFSEASFSKAFKRWEGESPGAYRRAQQKDHAVKSAGG